MDRINLLDRVLDVLRAHGAPFCVIGGVAVNAYVEPVVTLDVDLVVASASRPEIEKALAEEFRLEHFPHSVNLSSPESDLRLQIQTDPRLAPFVARAEPRDVLGLTLPVACIDDLLQAKVWAASDPTRRGSKRQKDLADIARLLEHDPRLRQAVPEGILTKLF